MFYLAFTSFQGNTSGQNWSAGGHIGFRLASGNVGWVKLTYFPFTLTIEEFAYEDMGGPISADHTTPIPKPGTLITLALGAAGLLAWRAHRQKRAKKAKNAENAAEEAG